MACGKSFPIGLMFPGDDMYEEAGIDVGNK